jgi:asparagine synthase (glutamine-hydrolysing)
MCGILGTSSKFPKESFNNALESIRHRGPDDFGIFEFPQGSFGFTRLSILEIQAGKQPLNLVDEQVVAMFNGEIYNYRELRESLLTEGVSFYGTSEVEVLARGYRHWGDSLFAKLKGMFAISIWDLRTSTLVLVRDPIGKKPLYLYRSGGEFAFASEIKALWELLPFSLKDIHASAVSSFLISDSVPSPSSIDSRIKKLKPGTITKISGEVYLEETFWPNSNLHARTIQADTFKLFEEVLMKSVARRLISEVPVGIFLSSGLDSRAVASMVARISPERIQSFTLKFDGSYDESVESERISKEFGFDHTSVSSSDEELAQMWFTAKEIMDEPLNDPAVLPMMLLSKAAQGKVKVAITGDGGDELFLGYPHMKLHKVTPFSNELFSIALKPFLNSWPDRGAYFGLGFRLQRLARGLGVSDLLKRDLAWRGGFRWYEIQKFLGTVTLGEFELEKVLEELTLEFGNSSLGDSIESRLSWWYLRTYLMDTVLVKVDRASMAFGVECRSPLLDLDLVELIFLLRDRGLLSEYPGKQMLVKVLEENGFALKRKGKKHGMGVPVLRLLKTVLNDEFEELTNLDLIETQGVFDVQAISKLKRYFYSNIREIRKEVWALFVFQGWMQRHLEQSTR